MTARNWYTPVGIACRALAWLSKRAGRVNVQLATAALYGMLDIHGVQGSANLIMKLRRQHDNAKKRTAKKTSVSGVRQGNSQGRDGVSGMRPEHESGAELRSTPDSSPEATQTASGGDGGPVTYD